MKISTKGRYGLRILLDIVLNGDNVPRLMRDIATSQNISEKYISRLVIDLRKAGLIKSVRGAKGGYKMARFPEDVTLLEIVETMEGRTSIVDCVLQPDACSKVGGCAVHQTWAEINRKIREVLSEVTLKDIADKHRQDGRASGALDYCI